MLNQLSFFLSKEYYPKAVATALQPVVPVPANEQEITEVICTATIEHMETITKLLDEIPRDCSQSF